MPLADLTRDAVLAALAEHDSLGRDAFLSRYGFSRARKYLLVHDGRTYDSKAVAGAAHGHLPGEEPLRADEFSGGDKTVRKHLEALGFDVRSMSSPDWTQDELILVCDLVWQNGWNGVKVADDRVGQLSALLHRLPVHPLDARPADFRTPSAVQRKTYDIATQHPSYSKKATRGGTVEVGVLESFLADPERMHQVAEAIRAVVAAGEVEEAPVVEEDEEFCSDEGRVLERRHHARERSPKLRREKVRAVLAEHGVLACEACGFDFERVYGERGRHYAEIHHKRPLHDSGPTRTRLGDLAVLCANCHRMIHRGKPWLTLVELKTMVAAHRA